MIQPQRAAVRPRAVSPTGETLLLEDEVGSLLAEGNGWPVQLYGPPGSGKTTALCHLAAVLPAGTVVTFLDEPMPKELRRAAADGFVVYTATAPTEAPELHQAVYRLAPWSEDDLIEYLLARHKDRCAAVMGRLRPADRALLGGLPDLWQIVLEYLAFNDWLPDARAALHRYLAGQLRDTDVIERARSACLTALLAGGNLSQAAKQLARPGFLQGLVRALRHPAVQVMLAAERIAADLHGESDCDFLARRLPRELVRAAAAEIAGDDRAFAHLGQLLAGRPWSHPMAASIRHALDPRCPPATRKLTGAYLDSASWPGADLSGAELAEADLSGSDLRVADLSEVNVCKADLSHTRLEGAKLLRLQARAANLSGADLSRVKATHAQFQDANLEAANFDGAMLRLASFSRANLARASFRRAHLSLADLTGTRIEGADFSGANLRDANLSGLRLRGADFYSADFTTARLLACDLEGMSLAGARFECANLKGALLTGSVMPDANFQGACLWNAGLAEIDWERADLRNADLTGASFHMGSSRSGLVFSPFASEGSRTGFYTDDYDEQGYKAPEDIRKANLCGADLRGATLSGVDFYLVDLRGAVYDPAQKEHLRRCGAILEARV